MKIYTSNQIGVESNCVYPNEVNAVDVRSFEKAASFDHVMAKYKNSYRSNDNFIESECVPMDIDNDHSENPDDWISVNDLKRIFDGVKFAIVYSRNHRKEKNGKAARPRMHIYFPIPKVTNLAEYVGIKERLAETYTFFDGNALDGARFFFGVKNPAVEIARGRKYITDILNDEFENFDNSQDLIQQGSRNSTMNHFAGRVLIRYGNTDDARELFDKKASLCSPPLPDDELEQIWRSACKFYKKVAASEDYVPPEEYNERYEEYKPEKLTDIAMAEIFTKHNKDKAIYTISQGWLYWTGKKWEDSELKVMSLYMETAKKVLENASIEFKETYQELADAEMMGSKEEKAQAKLKVNTAKAYLNFAKKMNDHGKVSGILKLAKSLLEVKNEKLDADAFILNTPVGVIDLKTSEIKEHDPSYYCTKITALAPSKDNMDMWIDTLRDVTGGDDEFINFLKFHAGSTLIGHVYEEALLIAYGDGGNGKSTVFNSEAHVLGDYAGKIPAESLTTRAKNVKVDLAELCGKRFILASETEEGQRLSSSMLKQIASVDDISAERKYYAPFSFTPTHSTILYTNHLPKVGSNDRGTWRRIVVAPFSVAIKNPKTDYIDKLLEKAGGAILQWMIEGAKEYIDAGFKYPKCNVVDDAKRSYKEENDWINHFISDKCIKGTNYKEMSARLYQVYREWAGSNGEYIRNNRDFSRALIAEGYEKKRTNRGIEWSGITINDLMESEDDFL